MGYPRTAAGAVSAAIEYWQQMGSTLDPALAAQIAALVADDSWSTAQDEFAQGVRRGRARLGLPPAGATPQAAGASGEIPGAGQPGPGSNVATPGPDANSMADMHVEVLKYQLHDPTACRVTVLLLAYVATTTATGHSQTRVAVLPAFLHWQHGDWKLERGLDRDYSSLLVQPGDRSALAGAGWLAVTS